VADEEAFVVLEIEIKAKIDSIEEMERHILGFGAIFRGQSLEDDTYYNHPARDFRETHEALRVRASDTAGSCITYKGPVLPGRAKSRLEAETGIEDSAAFQKILTELGFRYSGRVKKTRRFYDYKGATVTLDQIDGVGAYIEIEKIGENKTLLEEEVINLAKELGIHSFEKRSYLELVLQAEQK
jgi:adenylate cyclase, class 2